MNKEYAIRLTEVNRTITFKCARIKTFGFYRELVRQWSCCQAPHTQEMKSAVQRGFSEEACMRRLTVAVLALGCLALGIASMSATPGFSTATVYAQQELVGGLCPREPTCPGDSDNNPKAEVCHYDKGKPEGHINCQNAESITSHIGDGGHDRDYCAADTERKCITGGKP